MKKGMFLLLTMVLMMFMACVAVSADDTDTIPTVQIVEKNITTIELEDYVSRFLKDNTTSSPADVVENGKANGGRDYSLR